LFQFDLSIAFPLIDLLLGGEGKGSLEPREVTEIEEQLLECVVQIVCRQLGVAWQAPWDWNSSSNAASRQAMRYA